MPGWGAGYVTELDYIYGYFRELSPAIHRFALICAGVHPPPGIGTDEFAYLELGFGQGVSLNVHAAASRGQFWGTDFNPAQAAFARESAEEAETGVRAFDLSFAELAGHPDLPQFDAIAMHGIWSWVSEDNRGVLLDLIRSRLKPGGVAYVSHNTMPGWAASAPLQALLRLHAEFRGAPEQGVLARLGDALGFARSLLEAEARYFKVNPEAAERLQKFSEKDPVYLAHELLNDAWAPMHVSQVARRMAEAKLSLAASADVLRVFEGMNVSEAGRRLLAGIGDPLFRESVRDYLTNEQFRRDLYVRGVRRMLPHEQVAALASQRFVLATPMEQVSLTLKTPAGPFQLDEAVYAPVLEALAMDAGAPKSGREIEERVRARGVSFRQVVEVLTVLCGSAYASPAQDERTVDAVASRCRAWNRYVCERARTRGEVTALASPVVGHGVSVAREGLLFLLARAQKLKTPDEWAAFAWSVLGPQGQRLVKDGQRVDGEAENVAALSAEAKTFAERHLPTLLRLRATP